MLICNHNCVKRLARLNKKWLLNDQLCKWSVVSLGLCVAHDRAYLVGAVGPKTMSGYPVCLQLSFHFHVSTLPLRNQFHCICENDHFYVALFAFEAIKKINGKMLQCLFFCQRHSPSSYGAIMPTYSSSFALYEKCENKKTMSRANQTMFNFFFCVYFVFLFRPIFR